MRRILTKSYYLTGLECPKYLWISVNQPEKKRRKTLVEDHRLREGIKVGEIAKRLFPDGVDIPIDDYYENLQKTNERLGMKKALFEAGFVHDNCFSRVDILVPVGEEWDILEVKSSKKVKDINIHDVTFQRYVCESNGLKIRKCFLVHLNDDYVRIRKLEVEKLFMKTDITSEVESILEETKKRIKKVFKTISLRTAPKAGIFLPKIIKNGVHDCRSEECLTLPENNVFRLYRGGKKAIDLYEKGIIKIKQIPSNYKLTEKQKIQRNCEVNRNIYVNKKKINEFLGTLLYPLFYLDFETISTAIPMFNGLKPHAQVPFQFSLHVVKEKGEKPIHFEYLYDGCGDPRKEFLQELQKVLGKEGSIIVYNQSFEIGRLKELAEYFTKQKKWVDSVLKRIVDLLVPFREFSYYNPVQQGSASIKAVYQAVTGKSYEEKEIREGQTASIEYFRATYEECDEKEKRKVRENLLDYCKLDTMAQVLIVNNLRDLVN